MPQPSHTPFGSPNPANVRRAELHLLGAFEDLVISSMQLKRLHGLDLTIQIAALAKIDRMKAEARAGAHP